MNTYIESIPAISIAHGIIHHWLKSYKELEAFHQLFRFDWEVVKRYEEDGCLDEAKEEAWKIVDKYVGMFLPVIMAKAHLAFRGAYEKHDSGEHKSELLLMRALMNGGQALFERNNVRDALTLFSECIEIAQDLDSPESS